MEGSFEQIAAWWDTVAGDAGDFYAQHLILPAVLRTLGDVRGRSVLDLGAGNGMLSRVLARRGAQVTGIEIAPSLVARARERERQQPAGITYVVADAARLPMLQDASFQCVTANMVLMDSEDAAGMLRESGRLLAPNGRFVASLLHPCFEVCGGSAWMDAGNEPDQAVARRIWRYREPFSSTDFITHGQPAPIMRYHRPLNWYASRLREAQLLIDTLDEPVPDQVFAKQKPKAYRRQQVVPSFLIIGAHKMDVTRRASKEELPS